jgi:hypothetical protein
MNSPLTAFPAPWHPADGSYGRYVKVVDANGKTVANIPWGEADGSRADAIASLPRLLTVVNNELLQKQDHYEALLECVKMIPRGEHKADERGECLCSSCQLARKAKALLLSMKECPF